MASYARYDWPFLDRKTLDDMGDAYAGAAASGRLPSLVWGHLLGPDEVAHADGPGSAEFHATLASIDKAFGRLVRRLRKLKVDDRILFVLVGDHGNRTYHTFVDANELVNRVLRANPTEADCTKGDCVLVSAPRKDKTYDVGDAMIAVGAYRGAMIWLPSERPPEEVPAAFRTRKQKSPKGPPAPRLRMPPVSAFAATLARAPEVRLVVTRGPAAGRVVVYGPVGPLGDRARRRRRRPAALLVPRPRGRGPARLRRRPRGHGASSAPRATRTTGSTRRRPGRTPTSSSSCPSSSTRRALPTSSSPPPRATGSRPARPPGTAPSRRSETVVPLLFAGPGVPPGHRRAARTVDLAPTLLSLPRRPLRLRGDGRRRPRDRPRGSARDEAAGARRRSEPSGQPAEPHDVRRARRRRRAGHLDDRRAREARDLREERVRGADASPPRSGSSERGRTRRPGEASASGARTRRA